MVKKFLINFAALAIQTAVVVCCIWLVFRTISHPFLWQISALGALLSIAAHHWAAEEDKRETVERELKKATDQWVQLNSKVDDWDKLKNRAPLQEAVGLCLARLQDELKARTVAAQECAQRVYTFPVGDVKSIESYSHELREALSRVETTRRDLIHVEEVVKRLGFSKK